jgi:RNA-directed DNA polymerase
VDTTKPFVISKKLVLEAFLKVKANAGSSGIDGQTLIEFEKDLKNNLYKIWNRMSSGSYIPPPVKAVAIPKKSGGERILGIPSVSDRVAQMVAKLVFEPLLEPHFCDDSYGYRPGKSALDAVGVTRERCWKYPWVVEFDIRGLFDNIPHDLLMRAVRRHTDCKWLLLYIERWLRAPIQHQDGTLVVRSKGTPQGGVISPLLANLFLHYVFDVWITRSQPSVPWCRYADDGLLHCWTHKQAIYIRDIITKRFLQCGLELHPEKTKIVLCKDGFRKQRYETTRFDFLGYTFRPKTAWNNKRNSLFVHFGPVVSKSAVKAMCALTRKREFRNRTELSLHEIAQLHNATLRGWYNYYGKYTPSGMRQVARHFNRTLVSWAMRKFRRFRRRRIQACTWLRTLSKRNPTLFVHWNQESPGSFV